MSIFIRRIGLHPRTNRVMGAVNGETPGSVWHCAQASSPSSTQLTHLPNGVGCKAGSCCVKMPSHSHLLKLDLSLGPGRTRTTIGMGGGGVSTLLGASLYLT